MRAAARAGHARDAAGGQPGGGAEDNVETWSGKDRGDENFPVGSLLIRRALRPHVHAFYAFARNADDIADSGILPADEKIARLDMMEAVLLGRRDSPERPARCGCARAWPRPASPRATRPIC